MSETGEGLPNTPQQKPDQRFGARAVNSIRRIFGGNRTQSPEQVQTVQPVPVEPAKPAELRQQELDLKEQLSRAQAFELVRSLQGDREARQKQRALEREKFDADLQQLVQGLKEDDIRKRKARIDETRQQLQEIQGKNQT